MKKFLLCSVIMFLSASLYAYKCNITMGTMGKLNAGVANNGGNVLYFTKFGKIIFDTNNELSCRTASGNLDKNSMHTTQSIQNKEVVDSTKGAFCEQDIVFTFLDLDGGKIPVNKALLRIEKVANVDCQRLMYYIFHTWGPESTIIIINNI